MFQWLLMPCSCLCLIMVCGRGGSGREGHIRLFLASALKSFKFVTQTRIHWNSLTLEQKGDANKLLLLNYIYGYKGHRKPNVRCHIEYAILQ